MKKLKIRTMKWYKFDIKALSDENYEKWYSLMSKEKQERVDKIRLVGDKKRTVTGEMLAKKAIADFCCVQSQSIVFSKKENGKPYAKDLSVEFNVSHSGDMVVCAVDSKPVGIDVEKIRPIDLKIAKRVFTNEELAYLFGHNPAENEFVYTTDNEILFRFFEIWTSKEAYVKCTGDGIKNIKASVNSSAVQSFLFDDYIVSIYQDEIFS